MPSNTLMAATESFIEQPMSTDNQFPEPMEDMREQQISQGTPSDIEPSLSTQGNEEEEKSS